MKWLTRLTRPRPSPTGKDGLERATSELLTESSQALYEVIIGSEAVSHIPVARVVVAVLKAPAAIRDQILLVKVQKFLNPLRDVSAEERSDMISRLESEPAYKQRVGLQLIETLDRVNSHRKPSMLGAVFAAYARKQIDFIQMQRLNDAIERLPYIDIDSVRRFNSVDNRVRAEEFDPVTLQAFMNAGMASSQSGWGGLVYTPTPIGELFVKLDLDQQPA
jgi:hypothetical protein